MHSLRIVTKCVHFNMERLNITVNLSEHFGRLQQHCSSQEICLILFCDCYIVDSVLYNSLLRNELLGTEIDNLRVRTVIF